MDSARLNTRGNCSPPPPEYGPPDSPRCASPGLHKEPSLPSPAQPLSPSRLSAQRMNQQIRVVMLLRQFYPRTGGYQNQALRLARELWNRNIAVSVLTQRHGTLAPYEVHQQIHIHRVFTFRAGHLASVSYLFSTLLWMVRNRRQFQIIHANRSSSGLIAGLIGFVLRKKVLYKLTRGDEIEAK